jgi:hypothetical protein
VEPLRRKGIAQINMVEQILVAKVFNFGGICVTSSCLIFVQLTFCSAATWVRLAQKCVIETFFVKDGVTARYESANIANRICVTAVI